MPAVHLQQVHNIKNMFTNLRTEIGKVIVGQDEVVDQILVAIMCDANALLESYPGLGKTMIAKRIPSILPPMSLHEALEILGMTKFLKIILVGQG